MRLTETQLRRAIRKVLKESADPHDQCVEMVIGMLRKLNNVHDEWWSIESDAKRACRKIAGDSVSFSEVLSEALMFFGIQY